MNKYESAALAVKLQYLIGGIINKSANCFIEKIESLPIVSTDGTEAEGFNVFYTSNLMADGNKVHGLMRLYCEQNQIPFPDM